MNNKEREMEQFRAGKLQEYVNLAETEAKGFIPIKPKKPEEPQTNPFKKPYKPKEPPEILPEGFKRCPTCKKVLPFSEFYKHYTRKNKITSECKVCLRARAKRNSIKKRLNP